MRKFKILFVGGTWDKTQNKCGKASGLAKKIIEVLKSFASVLTFANGGNYDDLQSYIDDAKNYDIVFWWANVDNSLPKIRDVKAAAPHVMLITSKRNDDDKYSFQELVQKALVSKSNLVFEFKKINGMFKMMIFDPLGCVWYDGFNTDFAVTDAMNRLDYLSSITRKKTTQIDDDKNLILKWYFDQFAQEQIPSNKTVTVPDEQAFVNIVRDYAEVFHQIMKPAPNVKRFLGNCSMKPYPPQVGRCSKGMPSFRKDGYIFVSQRNVDKEYLTLENFVPTYLENGEVFYCGDNKPSVDTPIQLRLYEALPNINYMIHSHTYVEDAPFTDYPIPCGAIEEVDEILKAIDKYYTSRNNHMFRLNLKGHGSIVMAENLDDLKDIRYYGRPLPERFCL